MAGCVAPYLQPVPLIITSRAKQRLATAIIETLTVLGVCETRPVRVISLSIVTCDKSTNDYNTYVNVVLLPVNTTAIDKQCNRQSAVVVKPTVIFTACNFHRGSDYKARLCSTATTEFVKVFNAASKDAITRVRASVYACVHTIAIDIRLCQTAVIMIIVAHRVTIETHWLLDLHCLE